jgi:hypothetical protein
LAPAGNDAVPQTPSSPLAGSRATLVREPRTTGRPPIVSPVTITLREITEENSRSMLALRCTTDQERFVTSVADSLTEADA